MKLHALQIKNVPDFLDQAFLLGRSNTFLGVNGAGKTRLLDLIERLLQTRDRSNSILILKIEGESILDFRSSQIQNQDPEQTGYGNLDDCLFSSLLNYLNSWQRRANFTRTTLHSGRDEEQILIDDFASDIEQERNLRLGGRMMELFRYLDSTPLSADGHLPKENSPIENFWSIFITRFLSDRSVDFTNSLLQTCLSNTFLALNGENSWCLYGLVPHFDFDKLEINEDFLDVFSALNFPFSSLSDVFINSSEGLMTERGLVEFSVYGDATGIYIPLLGNGVSHLSDDVFRNGVFLSEVVPKVVRANSDFAGIQMTIEESILKISENLQFLVRAIRPGWLVESEQDGKAELSPFITLAKRWFVERVNQCLPSFISEEFRFSVHLLSPWEWEGNDMKKCIGSLSRLRPDVVFPGKKVLPIYRRFNIEDMGSGIASWTSVAISIATSSLLEDGFLLEFDQSMLKPDDDDNFVRKLLTQIFDQTQLDSVKLPMRTISYLVGEVQEEDWVHHQEQPIISIISRAKLDSSLSSETVLIVDEPEANLHPAALISITQWLVNFSSGMTGLFMATHSPKIFDAQLHNIKRFYISRASNSRHQAAVNMFPNDASALHPWSEELGVTTGELFLMTKKWLIVEGLFDQKILYIWFKEVFALRGIRCLNARGTKGVDYTMQMDVLAGLCASVAVLLDTPVNPDEIDSDKILRLKWINNLLQKTMLDGDSLATKKVEPEKVQLVKKEHSKFDIWFFLDASLIVKLGGLKYLPKFKEKWEFSDWDTAWSKFQEDRTKKNKGIEEENPKYIRGTVKSFKRFMRDEYGLNMDSNIKLAEKVAKTMLKNGEVPQELEEIIHSIISPHASTGLYNAS